MACQFPICFEYRIGQQNINKNAYVQNIGRDHINRYRTIRLRNAINLLLRIDAFVGFFFLANWHTRESDELVSKLMKRRK